MLSPLLRILRPMALLSLLLLLALPSWSQAVLTQQRDNSRTGADLSETVLNTSNVGVDTFGKLFSCAVDGYLFAQPLYVPAVTVGGAAHNVLYVATAHDSVYAFDADTGAKLWRVSLGTAVPSSVINTPNIQKEVGIIGTPVIDPTAGALYVVAKTYANSVQQFYLHALDITTGQDKIAPVRISAQVVGVGDGNDGANPSHVPFLAAQENQRPALTLVTANGHSILYIAFASHEDYDPYHGWVLAYDAARLSPVAVYNSTPNGGRGGLWMSGQGLVVDAANNVYALTGNSSQSAENDPTDFGETFLKLTLSGSTLAATDYFKPTNYDDLNAYDTDLGSGGAVGIPGTTYIIGGGKQGLLYLVDTTNMGGLSTNGTDSVRQEFQAENGLWGAPIFWNSATPTLYVWGVGDVLKAYPFSSTTGLFTTTPSSVSSPATPGGDSCGALAVSSNGSAAGTGIVWASTPLADPDHDTVSGALYAFDATNLSKELWDSHQNAPRDDGGNYAKFCPPTVANGKVYLPTNSGTIAVYGLLPHPSAPPAPTGLAGSPGNSQVALVWTAPPGSVTSYALCRGTTSGQTVLSPYKSGITTTSYRDFQVTNGTTYYYQVVAVNANGNSVRSNLISVTPSASSQTAISLNFVGGGGNGTPSPMAASEIAGVLARPDWNNLSSASGTASSVTDSLGAMLPLSVSWNSDVTWSLPITESPGNARMMKGYLDTPNGTDTVTVSVSGLPAAYSAGGYDVYVYADGDNGGNRTGGYKIGATTINLTDSSGTDFGSAFVKAQNSAGNYLIFPNQTSAAFTLTATPGATDDGTARAPVNGIQIVAHPSLFTVTVQSVSTGKTYTTTRAIKGALVYSDQTYTTITSIDATLSNGILVRTAEADAAVTAANYLTLNVSAPATLYVCYDIREKTLPAWLNDGTWTRGAQAISTSSTGASPQVVFYKSVPAGVVTLGGNLQAPAAGARTNYFVIAQPK